MYLMTVFNYYWSNTVCVCYEFPNETKDLVEYLKRCHLNDQLNVFFNQENSIILPQMQKIVVSDEFGIISVKWKFEIKDLTYTVDFTPIDLIAWKGKD